MSWRVRGVVLVRVAACRAFYLVKKLTYDRHLT
jgi:hypothetical protein